MIFTEGTPGPGSLTECLNAIAKLLLERNKKLRLEIYEREIDGEPVYKLLRKAITSDRKHCLDWQKALEKGEAKDWDAELSAKQQLETENTVKQVEARIEAGANMDAISVEAIDPVLMSEPELLCLVNHHANTRGGVSRNAREGDTWGWAFNEDPENSWLFFSSYQLSPEDPMMVWELTAHGSMIVDVVPPEVEQEPKGRQQEEEVIPATKPGGEPEVNPDEHPEESW